MATMNNAEKNHRISKNEQDTLMQYVSRKIAENGPRSNELSEALNRYIISNATAHSKRSRDTATWKVKRLTYASLSGFLRCCGITYKEAIEVISGRQISWNSKAQEELSSYLETLEDSKLNYLIELTWSMIPNDYKELYDLSELRSYRIQKAISYKNPDKDFRRIFREKYGLSNVWKLSQRGDALYNHFEIGVLPILSAEGDVGLHWLMGLDETESILSSNGKVEKIMDNICFLPRDTQYVLYRSILGKEYKDNADEK